MGARAADLIKAASVRPKARTVPPALLKELKAVIDHNDGAPHAHRVHASQVMTMLTDGGVQCTSLTTLITICREQLGRQSWAKK